MKTLLLLDLRNLLFRGLHVFSELSHNDNVTGPLYFLIQKVASERLAFDTLDIVVCDDTPPYFRKRIFPAYKSNREKDTDVHEIMQWTHSKVAEFLHLVGIPLIKYKGFEADDLLAILADNYKDDYDRIVIISNDTDLNQLLEQVNLYLLRGSGKNRKLYSTGDFRDQFPGFKSCKLWAEVAAIEGGHNGLPGVHGVGIKTAIQWVISEGEHKRKMRLTKRGLLLKDNANLIECSIPLAIVPFPDIKGQENIRFKMGKKSNERELIKFLGHVGITYTREMGYLVNNGY